MTQLSPHTLGPIMQALPVALAISTKLLLSEKSIVRVVAMLAVEKPETEMSSSHQTEVFYNKYSERGWSHFGIND